MRKKLIATCMASMVCTACVLMPALATAKPVITHPTGTVLAVGAKITFTNVGNVGMKTPIGELNCSVARLTGALKRNNKVEGIETTIETAAIGGTGLQAAGEPEAECTGTGSLPNTSVTPNPAVNGLSWCLKALVASDEIQIKGDSCGAVGRAIRFTLAMTGIGNCVYERANAVIGTLRTDKAAGEDATISIAEQEWSGLENPFLCPANVKLNMTLTLETDQATTNPMYFSE